MSLTLAALLLGAVLPVYPMLAFDTRTVDDKTIVLAYDCGRVAKHSAGRECAEWEGGVSHIETDSITGRLLYPGDSVALESILRRQRVDEVWLVSGGGSVVAGLGMARLFRSFGMLVRVPGKELLARSRGSALLDVESTPMCVSACTLAFMGAPLRFVDRGSEFVVHSGSLFNNNVNPIWRQELQGGRIGGAAGELQKLQCDLIFTEIRIFQNTLHAPNRVRNERLFSERLGPGDLAACQEVSWYSAADQARDMAVISLEGYAAHQDILMRLERLAVKQALDYWRRRTGALGASSEAAIRMVESMYAVRITGLSPLSEIELIGLGYVTQLIDAPSSR